MELFFYVVPQFLLFFFRTVVYVVFVAETLSPPASVSCCDGKTPHTSLPQVSPEVTGGLTVRSLATHSDLTSDKLHRKQWPKAWLFFGGFFDGVSDTVGTESVQP